MRAATFHERRKNHTTIDSTDRRIVERRQGGTSHVPERRRLPSKPQNGELRISAHLKADGESLEGIARDINSNELLVLSSKAFDAGTAVKLKFSFGENFCYMSMPGQIIFCHSNNGNAVNGQKYSIGIKFSPIFDWEKKVLASAVEEMCKAGTISEQASLDVEILNNDQPKEQESVSLKGILKSAKRRRKFTPHPSWVLDLEKDMEPYRQAILESKLVVGASKGTLSVKQMRSWIVQLYPFIEAFPKYIALNITKAQDQYSTSILIDNVRVEKRHAQQWLIMGEAFGITSKEMVSVQPIPQVDALSHWLWSINTQGTLAEAVSANTYAIEGITSGIARQTVKGFIHYDGLDGVSLDKKAYLWMEAHAHYDDEHPIEALEIIKLYALTKDVQEKVKYAAQRSLEFLLMALDACYEHGSVRNV